MFFRFSFLPSIPPWFDGCEWGFGFNCLMKGEYVLRIMGSFCARAIWFLICVWGHVVG